MLTPSRRILAATSTAFAMTAGTLAQGVEAPPAANSALEAAANTLQARADANCAPEADGNKAKGQFTNADIGALVRRAADIPASYKTIKIESIEQRFNMLANLGAIICMNSAVNTVKSADMPIELQRGIAQHTATSAIHLKDGIISLNPVSVDGSGRQLPQSLALLDAADHLAIRLAHFQLNQIGANEAHANGNSMREQAHTEVLRIMQNYPIAVFMSPANPDASLSGTSEESKAKLPQAPVKAPNTKPSINTI